MNLSAIQREALLAIERDYFLERLRSGRWVSNAGDSFDFKTIRFLERHGYVNICDEFRHVRARLTRGGNNKAGIAKARLERSKIALSSKPRKGD